jgi:hypothetical protein
MARGRKIALLFLGSFIALFAMAGVYFFLPTAPKTIEGAWVSEDGLVVGTYGGGTGRQFMEETYAKNGDPDQTFKYSVTGNTMRISDGKEAGGKDVSLPPMMLAVKFSFGNRRVTLYDGGQRVSTAYRVGSPEARLLHLSNNWYK